MARNVYVTVPIEPSEAMLRKAREAASRVMWQRKLTAADDTALEALREAWRAMIEQSLEEEANEVHSAMCLDSGL